MFAKLSALVGGGPALNYNVDPEPYEVAWGCWTHFGGTSREDGSPVSVFRIAATDPNDLKLTAARNGVKRLRMVSITKLSSRTGCAHTEQQKNTSSRQAG
jgi:SCY1-like protein 1